MDIIHVCGPPDGAARGMQLAVMALVLAGAPLAVLGIVLAAVSTREALQWTSAWKPVFRAAFVVQVSSVGVTAPIAVLVVTTVLLDNAWDLLPGVVAFVSAAASSVALPAWRRLIGASAPETPISIR